MTVNEIIRLLSEHRDLLDEFQVKALYLFGSIVRGEDHPSSDVDVLVEFEANARIGLFAFARLQRLLSGILARPVDLVTPDALHEAMREQILKEAVLAA